MRSRDYLRRQRALHIKRKQRIIKDQHDYWQVSHEGMLNKGKIHCSCPMCRHKSYDSPKIRDLRQNQAMDAKETEMLDTGV